MRSLAETGDADAEPMMAVHRTRARRLFRVAVVDGVRRSAWAAPSYSTRWAAAEAAVDSAAPLATRMRPRSLDEFVGQRHILAPGKLLRRAIEADRLPSVIFSGPPGTGKTTLAQIIAEITHANTVGRSVKRWCKASDHLVPLP